MESNKIKRYTVLGILFLLPVAFLLMLYPAKHNYEPLNIVSEKVAETQNFTSDNSENVVLKDRITVLGFFGKAPMDMVIAASNLKELVYDKFKGFKDFQIVIIVPQDTEAEIEDLKREINTYEDLKFWHYAFGTEEDIRMLYNSLRTQHQLSEDLSVNNVFIIDKDLNQRGRIDGRTERQIEDQKPAFSVYSYNTIEVAEIKNMMSDDVRILFTEYRQKRKGKFEDSNTRREKEINKSNE